MNQRGTIRLCYGLLHSAILDIKGKHGATILYRFKALCWIEVSEMCENICFTLEIDQQKIIVYAQKLYEEWRGK